MTAPTSHARTEILDQAVGLTRTLSHAEGSDIDLSDPSQRIVLTGCGSSLYIAQLAAAHARQVHHAAAWAVPASEVWLDPEAALAGGDVLVAISRSGSTTEVLRAVEAARRAGVRVVGLTIEADAPLVDAVDDALVLSDVEERGIVMTVSFASMALALQLLIGGPSRPRERSSLASAVEHLPGLLPAYDQAAAQVVAGAPRRYVFLGAGAFAALAEEAALKMREMTQVPVDAFQTLEFRHGPISIVEQGVTVVAMRGARDADVLDAVGAEVLGLGGSLVQVAPGTELRGEGGIAVRLPDGLTEGAYAVLALPFVQLVALHQAEALGLHPDEPRHLGRVVTLDTQEA